MKVLITHQFNSAMLTLESAAQSEAVALYSFALNSDKEHIIASSLTKITSQEDNIFTLRGTQIRVFCTFSNNKNEEVIVFLDIKPSYSIDSRLSSYEQKGEVTLFDKNGQPVAYIEDNNEKTIFTFNGEPLAYIDEKSNIYGFNGKHLGWFEDQIIWNQNGERVGFTKSTSPVFVTFEPFKGFKQFKPFKSFKEFAPLKPLKSYNISQIGLLEFLKSGKR